MEIRRSDQPSGLFKSLFENIVAWLDTKIDRSVIASDLAIADADDYAFHAEKLIEDKREINFVDSWLSPISDRLFRAHRAVTGKRAEFQSYAQARATIRERALSAWSLAEEKRKIETAKRIEEQQRQEEEARRENEAKSLREQGKHKAADEVLDRPIVTTRVAVSTAVPQVKGISGKKKYKATIQDEDALLKAIVRADVYVEAAAALTGKYGKDAAKFARFLKDQAKALPTIPRSIIEFKETKANTFANAADGRIDWPGVVVEEDYKTNARSR